MLGQLFFERGDLFNAMKEWKKTVEIKPTDPASLTQLGNVYQVSNDPLKARELYARAIQANPNHYEAQYNMALVSEKLGETADALEHYEVFLKLVPSRDSWLVPVVEGKISTLKETLRAAGNPSPLSHQEGADGTRPMGKK
jgi:Tfp pilus assembly protein PilF